MPSKKILIVDDDDMFRDAITMCLEKAGFEVAGAPDGRTASQMIGAGSFDATITDIRMPEMTGIQLLHHIKRHNPMPVILMTGFAELAETQEAYEMGADGFIPKPFRKEELLEVVRKCLGLDEKTAGEEENDLDTEFCKIGIEDFVSGREIQCDIYVRLSAAKYVKIAHQGEDIAVERIRAYKVKNLRYLYMRQQDFRKYIGFSMKLSDAAQKSDRVPKATKLNLLRHTGELIMEHLYTNELNRDSFEDAKTVVETTVSMLGDEKDTHQLIGILNNHSDALYAHSLGVSLYGSLIARQMKWKSPMSIFKVSMGGLLHDVGLKEIDKEIINKSRQERSPEEVRIYESHPKRGAELLSRVSSVPSDVIQIVMQHHEDCLGLGYPSGLKKNHIFTLARLVSVADTFCELTLKGPESAGMPPSQAIQRMLSTYSGALDLQFFEALMNIFSIEPTQDFLRLTKRWRSA